MKKHAISNRRAAAEPFSVRRTSDRPQPETSEQPEHRRPRRHDHPFRDRDADGPRGPSHDPARYDRRTSRHQLRDWERGWGDADPEDGGSEAP